MIIASLILSNTNISKSDGDTPIEGIDYIVNEVGEVIPVENTDFAYSRFEFTTDRIAGRSKTINDIPQTHKVTSTTLPDVNVEDLQDLNLIKYIESGKLHSGIPIDIMIS